MIGKLFEVQGDVIIPKEDCYIIKPLRKIIDTFPNEYGKVLAYIHYMKSLRPSDNPYADVPLHERSEQILHDLDLELDPEDPIIIDALDCVEEKYYTTAYGMYKGMKTMMDKIASKFFTEDIDFSQKEGNSANILRYIKDYEALRKGYKDAYRDFDQDINDGRARGGASLADDEETDY